MNRVSHTTRLLPLVGILALAGGDPRPASAGCNIIPPAVTTFRASLGSVDRPFARPGDWVEVALDPGCAAASPGFPAANAVAVTIIFTPPNGGPRNIVVLAEDCGAVDTASCEARPDVASATCQPANVAGDPVDLEVADPATLRFRFPRASIGLGGSAAGLPLTGPAKIAVTPTGATLPCGLASLPCRQYPGLRACVDSLFAANGTCNTQPHSTFRGFTALPFSNDYQSLCVAPVPPCTGTANQVLFTVDAAGNLLIPMDWRGVRVDRDAVPVARLLRTSTTVEAFPGRGVPLRIDDLESLSSYSIDGIKLPPLFDPQSDPTDTGSATFFGSTDAEETVLRFARHREPSFRCAAGANVGLPCGNDSHCAGEACVAPVCLGGSENGSACTTDFDCPGGECGPGLFDFSSRLVAGRGPVVLRLDACIGGTSALASCTQDSECPGGQCGAFTMAALDPVPLDGLNQSAALSCFVMEEAIAEADLNGDGDEIDSVVKLVDRATGAIEAIGDGGAEARAVARLQQPPFSFPALAVNGDLIAFLEPEPRQGGTDIDANARIFDNVLRVYRLGGGEETDPLAPLVADAAPLVAGRSLAVSEGMVFFRTWEAAMAMHETTRVNVDSSGNQATGGFQFSFRPSLSADGRHVAFTSHATNLVPGDTNNVFDIFVRDRLLQTTTRVSVSSSGAQSNGFSMFAPHISADGRHVAFSSNATNLVPGDTNVCPPGSGGWPGSCVDIFVHDRDADGNGVFDETGPGARATARVSIASDGTQADDLSVNDIASISPDGRFVTFSSDATNLVPDDTNGVRDVFIHDRDADADGIFDETGPGERATIRASVASDGSEANGASENVSASGDGRFVVFESTACNLIAGDCATTGDTNGVGDIFLRDRDADGDGIFDEPGAVATIRVSVDASGAEGNGVSFAPSISTDGGTIVYSSLAGNLVPGDTNSKRDVFAYDRLSGNVSVFSTTPAGRVSIGNSGSASTTPGGRFAIFANNGGYDDIVPGVPITSADVYLHDRLTRVTARISLAPDGTSSNDHAGAPVISADGTTVAYHSRATNLVAGDTNGQDDIFVRGPLPGSGDLTGDGDDSDTVLRVVDTTTGPPSTVIDLCPARAVAVAAGRAAFLRPEAAGDTPALAGCPSAPLLEGRPDLNGDGDADDEVVHLWDGSDTVNLGRAATAVEISADWIGALISEKAEGGAVLNGDGDAEDTVVHVHPAGAGAWTNLGQAARTMGLAGNWLAFITDESSQGGAVLNGDGDADDGVLQVYDAGAAYLTNVGQAGEEMVVGSTGLVAFRTLEARQGGAVLNGDGDADDGVLQVYDGATGVLLNSGQAVTPCRLEACDPRVPYRVRDDTVTFLTLEADQGADLNGDGDLGDLVLQVLNVRQACGGGGPSGTCHTLAAASAGVCTDSGEACVDDDTCPAGECFVPPGGCLRDLGTACNATTGSGCGSFQFCQPILGSPGQGTCFEVEQAAGGDRLCAGDANCGSGFACSQSSRDFNRLMDPLGNDEDGSAVFTGAGRCTEQMGTTCSTSDQCEPDEFCSVGLCRRQHGVCASDADCPSGSVCTAELVRSTAVDSDSDELPDVVDNCPEVANIMQHDLDADGIGDACDAETCGNAVVEEGEECDDGNTTDDDGCQADCSLLGQPVAAVKIVLKDKPRSGERHLVFVSKDKLALAAPAGPAQDPTVGGALLKIRNPATQESAALALPAAHWTGLGNPAGSRGYKYRDPTTVSGPCKVALLKPGKALKAVCRSAAIDFTLDEAQQGSLGVELRSGTGTGALKFCAHFGGEVVKDEPATESKTGMFKARKAPAPASCQP